MILHKMPCITYGHTTSKYPVDFVLIKLLVQYNSTQSACGQIDFVKYIRINNKVFGNINFCRLIM